MKNIQLIKLAAVSCCCMVLGFTANAQKDTSRRDRGVAATKIYGHPLAGGQTGNNVFFKVQE